MVAEAKCLYTVNHRNNEWKYINTESWVVGSRTKNTKLVAAMTWSRSNLVAGAGQIWLPWYDGAIQSTTGKTTINKKIRNIDSLAAGQKIQKWWQR